MNRIHAHILALALTLCASGCALAPKDNLRLEEARRAHAQMQRDSAVARYVPAEARRADEALERAHEAWSSLQDPALVDHLAYLARQRALIAAETARHRAAQERLQSGYPNRS